VNERLEVLIVRLALSKKAIGDKFAYLALGALFYPLLKRDEQSKSAQAKEASEAGAAGDDVYPLF
jgi:hypothetical protein